MTYIPRSYNFFDLIEPEWSYGPVWDRILFDIFGLCGIVETKTPLHSLDLVAYNGDVFVVPAHPDLRHSLIWTTHFATGTLLKCQAKLIDRVQWLLISGQRDRLTQYHFIGDDHGISP